MNHKWKFLFTNDISVSNYGTYECVKCGLIRTYRQGKLRYILRGIELSNLYKCVTL